MTDAPLSPAPCERQHAGSQVQHAKRVPRLVSCLLVGFLMPHVGWSWSGYNKVTVSLVTIYEAGIGAAPGALIQFSGGTGADNEGCTQSGKNLAWIDWSSSILPDGKAIYATVLAAQLAGKLIGIGLNGCSSAAVGGYPLVYGINVYP